MTQRNPLAVARGLGSAKSGSGHWWIQRLTAIVLALLTPWVIYFLVVQMSGDQWSVREAIAEPMNSSLLLAFMLALFWHAQLGLQVVVEDYVHIVWLEIGLQITIKLVYAFAALASILAIGRIAFAT